MPYTSVILVQRRERETFLVKGDAWTMSSSSQWVLLITSKQNFESLLQEQRLWLVNICHLFSLQHNSLKMSGT